MAFCLTSPWTCFLLFCIWGVWSLWTAPLALSSRLTSVWARPAEASDDIREGRARSGTALLSGIMAPALSWVLAGRPPPQHSLAGLQGRSLLSPTASGGQVSITSSSSVPQRLLLAPLFLLRPLLTSLDERFFIETLSESCFPPRLTDSPCGNMSGKIGPTDACEDCLRS